MANGFAVLFAGLAVGVAYGGYECLEMRRRRDALQRALLAVTLVVAAAASLVYLPGERPDPFRRQRALGFGADWTCLSPKGEICVKLMQR